MDHAGVLHHGSVPVGAPDLVILNENLSSSEFDLGSLRDALRIRFRDFMEGARFSLRTLKREKRNQFCMEIFMF